MKIIYIHQYFKTPVDGGSLRSYYFAKALIDEGHQVEMITSWNNKIYEVKDIEGIKVHYLPVYYDNSLEFLGRVSAFLKFTYRGFLTATKINGPDVVYASSTPITVGLISLGLKFFYKLPYYFEVRDLWPLAPIELGYINNGFLKKALLSLEKLIYQNAEKIITLSPGMKEWVGGINFKKEILMLPNMADCDFFEKGRLSPIPFTVVYFGTVGEANHLEYFVSIAHFFQEKELTDIKFLIIGNGKQWENINLLISILSLKNIEILHAVNKEELKVILSKAHAAYISFAPNKVLTTSSPNKFFDSLASGKLIISNVKGWIMELIEENNCGFYSNPQKPENFHEKLKPYLDDNELLNTAMENSRKLAEERFERKMICKEFCDLFKN